MEEVLTIQERMSRVMKDVGAVGKDKVNQQQHYPFRGIDSVVNAVSPAMQKHGVIVVPRLEHIEYVPLTSSAGKTLMSCRVIVTYTFIGAGGDRIDAKVAGEAFDSGDKATAKSMSVAFRIALLQALALPTDDVDPDSQSYEMSAPASAAPGESTVQASRGQGSVTSPSVDHDAQAAQDAASPSHSVASGVATDAVESSATDPAQGEGAIESRDAAKRTTGAEDSTTYLDRDDQSNLIEKYGGKVAAIKAYKARFGNRINNLGDVTYPMMEELEGGA